VAALAQHRGIDYDCPDRAQRELCDPQGRLHAVPLPWRARFSDLQAVADAAIAGAGIAWLPNWLLARYVQTAQLEAVLPDHRAAPMSIHVLWPRAHHMPAKTRCAIDALVAAVPACMEECRDRAPSAARPRKTQGSHS